MKTQFNDTLALRTFGRIKVAIVKRSNQTKQVIVFSKKQRGGHWYLFQTEYQGTIKEGFQIAAAFIG